LLQVALEVIVARGVAGATYRLIAEAADRRREDRVGKRGLGRCDGRAQGRR